jgi:hypothetical protein
MYETENHNFPILDKDFQKLLGLVRDVDRLRGGLRLLLQTVRIVQKHPDTDTINTKSSFQTPLLP